MSDLKQLLLEYLETAQKYHALRFKIFGEMPNIIKEVKQDTNMSYAELSEHLGIEARGKAFHPTLAHKFAKGTLPTDDVLMALERIWK